MSHHPASSLAALGTLCTLLACGPDMNMNMPPPDTSMGDSKLLVGTFQVRLVAPVPATPMMPATEGYTSVVGKVYDGPTPALLFWTDATKSGSCVLRKPKAPFCSTPCIGGSVCVETDKCQAYPTSKTVGKVKVSGLATKAGASTFTMEPISNNYQIPVGTQCPYPAFSEGAEVKMETEGGAYAAFTLKSTGIKPLDLQNQMIAIDPDQSVRLTWTPANAAAKSKVHVKLDISHHGGTKGIIECDGEDTGSMELPGPLLTELLNLGVAGFPSIVVTRSSVGSATIAPGRVDLQIISEVEKGVLIKGLTSCTEDKDCPMGQTCQADLRCK